MKVMIFLVGLLVLVSFVSAEDKFYPPEGFGYNNRDGPIMIPTTNYSLLPTVNSSEWWGDLNTYNATQFDNLANVLNIDESWVNSNWLRLDGGNSPTSSIDWNGFGINNLGSLSLTQDINLIDKNWLVPTPTLPNHTANKDYVDDATSSTAFDFFFNNDSSDIAGSFNMTESDLEGPESTLDSGALGTGTFSIFNWTTLVGQPEFNELRQGVYDVHIHLNSDGPGKKPVVVTPKLYNISADGLIRTLLVTFETSDLLLSVGTEFDLHGVLIDPIMLDDGVRLNLELEAEVGAGGGDVTVTITMEGTTDSHLSVETSTNAFQKIFILRSGDNTLTGNWQVDSVANPFNINMTGNFSTGGLTVNGPTSLQGNTSQNGFSILNVSYINPDGETANFGYGVRMERLGISTNPDENVGIKFIESFVPDTEDKIGFVYNLQQNNDALDENTYTGVDLNIQTSDDTHQHNQLGIDLTLHSTGAVNINEGIFYKATLSGFYGADNISFFKAIPDIGLTTINAYGLHVEDWSTFYPTNPYGILLESDDPGWGAIWFGADRDGRIYHDGNDMQFNTTTGDIKFTATGGDVDFAALNLTTTGGGRFDGGIGIGTDPTSATGISISKSVAGSFNTIDALATVTDGTSFNGLNFVGQIFGGTAASPKGINVLIQQAITSTDVKLVNLNYNHMAGATTDVYGLYVNDILSPGNNYAIYTNDGIVHFGDNVEAANDIDVTGDVDISSQLSVGANATFITDRLVHVSDTAITSTTSSATGLGFNIGLTPSSTRVNPAYGVIGTVLMNNNENVTSKLYGGLFAVAQAGSGTIDEAIVTGANILSLGGTITSASNFKSESGITVGSITTGYGFRHEGWNSANVANKWAFFADADDSAFGGNVSIGSTDAPTVALDVTGDVLINTSSTTSMGVTSNSYLGGAVNMSEIAFTSVGGAGGIGTIKNGLYLRGVDFNPVLNFMSSDLVSASAAIQFNETDDTLNFLNAGGGYTFDDSITVGETNGGGDITFWGGSGGLGWFWDKDNNQMTSFGKSYLFNNTGIGVSPNDDYFLYVENDDVDGPPILQRNVFRPESSSDQEGGFYNALSFEAYWSGDYNLSERVVPPGRGRIVGVAGLAGVSTPGENIWVDLAIGGIFGIQGVSTGTITDGYGIQIPTPLVLSTSLTNNYGLKLEDQDQGDALNFAIHTGLGDVFF